MKYPKVAAAVWLFIGTALVSPARAQVAGAAPTAPSKVTSSAAPGTAALTANKKAVPAATAPPARLGLADHAAWVSTRPSVPSGLMPGDHVLIIQRTAPATNGAGAASAIPQAASRPEPRQTPSAAVVTGQAPPNPAPAAQPQPAAAGTPSTAPMAISKAPAPAATPWLSPIDHVLLVSVHPPGSPGAESGTDHAFPVIIDHNYPGAWTPGRELLASLHLPSGHHLTEGEELLMDTPDESCRAPINWSVIIHKLSYLMDVYYKGRLFETFPAVFGRNPDHSAKEWEGDLRTPEGNYLIIEKYYNPRWRWFLRLNYPNYDDRIRYESELNRGLVPVLYGHYRHLGGAIGIHGTDRPRFNHLHVNWTLGCISVDNDAIDELERLLPVGTLVIIKP